MSAFPGEKGRRIRELTSVVQKRFNFKENSVELYAEKVNNRGLCAIAQAESLRYKLLGGLAVRRSVPLVAFVPCPSFYLLSDLKAIFTVSLYVLCPLLCLRVTTFDPICLGNREIYLILISCFDESRWGNF